MFLLKKIEIEIPQHILKFKDVRCFEIICQ